MKVTEIIVSANRSFAYPNRTLTTSVAMRLEPDGPLQFADVDEANQYVQRLADEEKGHMEAYLMRAEKVEEAVGTSRSLEEQCHRLREEVQQLRAAVEQWHEWDWNVKDYIPCTCGHSPAQHQDADEDVHHRRPCLEKACLAFGKCETYRSVLGATPPEVP